jgi:hypothetical protein
MSQHRGVADPLALQPMSASASVRLRSPARPGGRLRETKASEILRSLAGSSGNSVPLRDIMSALQSRAHGIMIVLLALPDAVPIPLVSVSTVLGVPLIIVSAHLLVFGEGTALPERVLTVRIPRSVLRPVARFGAPILEAFELFMRPRWRLLLRHERSIGLVCLFLSIVLALPIPLLNFPPALCLLVIALGMVQRDGIVVAVGLLLTLAMSLSLGIAGDWLVAFLLRS